MNDKHTPLKSSKATDAIISIKSVSYLHYFLVIKPPYRDIPTYKHNFIFIQISE